LCRFYEERSNHPPPGSDCGEGLRPSSHDAPLSDARVRIEQIPVEYDWHYQHNLELLGTSYQYIAK
jgi:hypothetical protein